MGEPGQSPTGTGIFGEVCLYAGVVLLFLGVGTLYFDHKYLGGPNRTLGIVLTVLGVVGVVIAFTQRKAVSQDLDMDIGTSGPLNPDSDERPDG